VRVLCQRGKQAPWGQALWYFGIEMALLKNACAQEFEEERCHRGGVCCMPAWHKC